MVIDVILKVFLSTKEAKSFFLMDSPYVSDPLCEKKNKTHLIPPVSVIFDT